MLFTEGAFVKVDNYVFKFVRTVLEIVGSRIVGIGCEVGASWIMWDRFWDPVMEANKGFNALLGLQ